MDLRHRQEALTAEMIATRSVIESTRLGYL